MKNKFTRTHVFGTVAILVFTACLAPLMAQSEEQIERFNKERKAYFTQELELTDSELKAFWPLYDDFHNRKMKLVEEERNAFMYAHKNAENLSDEEITEILSKIRRLKHEQVDLGNDYYHHKFMEVLSPKKVLKLYKVEWDFRRHLLRELRGQGRDGSGRRGGKPGGGPGSTDQPPVPLM